MPNDTDPFKVCFGYSLSDCFGSDSTDAQDLNDLILVGKRILIKRRMDMSDGSLYDSLVLTILSLPLLNYVFTMPFCS